MLNTVITPLSDTRVRGGVGMEIRDRSSIQSSPCLLRPCCELSCSWLSTENPLFGDGDYRLEVLVAVQQLERLDKDTFSDEDKQEAARIYKEHMHEELMLVVCFTR